MSERTVYAGKLWVRRAKRRMRIKLSDRKRLKSFKRVMNDKSASRATNGWGRNRDVRREFLTLDDRNKLIKSGNGNQDLRNFTKLEIKERLFSAGIPVPLTYMTITDTSEIPERMEFLMKTFRGGFVIKPNDGHSGRGILAIKKVVGRRFITMSDEAWDEGRLYLHLDRILKGRFSRGRTDIAIIEERIDQHAKLRGIAINGLVDFRLIVSNGYPVMAMARLPTRRSRGKGNLHRGALGMGVSLHDGTLTSGVYMEKPASKHPDTGMLVSGFKIPGWQKILLTGARAQFFSSLKYAGVDMVVDIHGNIKVLEVNRRPGLAIQLANKAGLRKRLDYVDKLVNGSQPDQENGFESIKARVEFVMETDKSGWDKNGDQT
ncbi:MAG: alpha-L-glutamate ligase-like protein [Thermoplasmata archaeon]|nr:MAG: alpha-L-glutamate ligase-like protein [Thermoplasmata archaeon]